MALLEFKDLPNTETPVTAENLNNNFEYLKWKFLGTVTGNNSINLPNDWTELDILVTANGRTATVHLNNIMEKTYYRFGFYRPTEEAEYIVQLTANTIYLAFAIYNNTDYASLNQATMTAYYR